MLASPKPLAQNSAADLVHPIEHSQLVTEIIDLALREDLGSGDITSQMVVEADRTVLAKVLLKQKAVLAGMPIFTKVLQQVDSRLKVSPLFAEGTVLDDVPVVVATIIGPARSLLAAERTALNFLQRLCGVATITRQFVDLAGQAKVAILDTRKTTPGLRVLEKYAVVKAGGLNHRFGLYDAILIKDNHIQLAGNISLAIQCVSASQPDMRIEVEAATLSQVEQAIEQGVDAILLDNMAPNLVRQAIDLIGGKAFVEVSGGIDAQTIASYLIPGVNAISIGALTHSASSIDISLEIEG